MKRFPSLSLVSLLWLGLVMVSPLAAGDWPEWRGPLRDGISVEKGLAATWSPAGQNLAWKAPYGGRSAPIVMGDHLYLQNTVGKGPTEQERVLCLNADTGKLLWEHRINLYHSDVPVHRVGWASPAADPETGNVYALAVNGALSALSKDGELLWVRSMAEDFGIITTHGGRTVSPLLEGDLVIVSAVTFLWGTQAAGAHRFFAFDKKTGETIWLSAPEGRPTDTVYPAGVIATINGTRLLISGGSDGAFYALKPQTGEPVWKYEVSKRGINNGVALKGSTVIIAHSEENLDSSEMGMIAAIDGSAKGTIGPAQVKWNVKGILAGFPSPVLDGDRIYIVDNGSTLLALDFNTGKGIWKKSLGTVQKASPVLADGKLYVGTESGKFFILKPGPNDCQTLSVLTMPMVPTGTPEQVLASVAVARGRVYLQSEGNLYAIGPKAPNTSTPTPQIGRDSAGSGAPASLLVTPTELVLKPGESVLFHARLFDERGRFLREEKAAWSLDGLKGTVQDDGRFTAASENQPQAGTIKAAIGSLSAAARLRVIPPPPFSMDFESMKPGPGMPPHWTNATAKYEIRDVNGNRVLVKLKIERPFHERSRSIIGASYWSNYTVQADVYSTLKRRLMGDAGVTAQRFELVLFGNDLPQRVVIQSWQPETERTVKVPFEWKPDTWYRMKLEVQNMPDGKVRARGKVWLVSDPEPAAWTIERVETLAGRHGAPGLYGDAHATEVFFDNIKVTPNP